MRQKYSGQREREQTKKPKIFPQIIYISGCKNGARFTAYNKTKQRNSNRNLVFYTNPAKFSSGTENHVS